MSLINDALKRAKEAQQQTPTDPGGPPLRPVEPRPGRNNNVWLMLLFAIVVAVASILLWQWFQQWRQPQIVAGTASTSAQGSPTPTSTPSVTVPSQSVPVMLSEAAIPAVSASTTTVATVVPIRPDSTQVQPARGTSSSPASVSVPPMTNSHALATLATGAPRAEVVTEPAPLKLQGILFHPTRPSAVINGRLLFVGERVGELRVMAIEQDSVTLAGGGKTNYLTLR